MKSQTKNRKQNMNSNQTALEKAVTKATNDFAQDLIQVLSKFSISEIQEFAGGADTANNVGRKNNATVKKARKKFQDTFTDGQHVVKVRKNGPKYEVKLNGKIYSRVDRHQITSILHRKNYERVQPQTAQA